jgi:predicted transcriptional regulator
MEKRMASDQQGIEPERNGEAGIADLTAEIVSAYVSHNNISPSQLPELIGSVSSALKEGISGRAQQEPEPQAPAVPIRRSVKPDEIICLECGKRFKSIKRHLSNAHGLEPREYREKWGLRPDYPMTAPAYAEQRSALAKAIGLGQKRQAAKGGTKGRGKRAAKAKAEAAAT